jgi:hypothetical protein
MVGFCGALVGAGAMVGLFMLYTFTANYGHIHEVSRKDRAPEDRAADSFWLNMTERFLSHTLKSRRNRLSPEIQAFLATNSREKELLAAATAAPPAALMGASAAAIVPLAPVVDKSLVPPKDCGWRFLRYEPSAVEQAWCSNIAEWQVDICGSSDKHLYQVNNGTGKRWMMYVAEADANCSLSARRSAAKAQADGVVSAERLYPSPPTFTSHRRNVPEGIFSAMHYENTCDGTLRSTLIEPLAGMLRDPECCSVRDNPHFCEQSVLNKGYMLIDHDIPDRLSPQLPAHSPRPLPYATENGTRHPLYVVMLFPHAQPSASD